MGNDPPKVTISVQQKNQLEILKQAGKIAEQFKLFNSEGQLKEQRHLFARILVYGHSNIIQQLRKFNREQQKQMVRELKVLDYETTDLLYQNLVVKSEKTKTVYQAYSNYIDKAQERINNHSKYELIFEGGQEVFMEKKVAILLFAGGESTRFKNRDGQILQKQLYKGLESQKCLLQIALDKIKDKKRRYHDLSIYLVDNQSNHQKINTILTKYSELQVKTLLQHESPIVNSSGKLCIKTAEKLQIMTLPSGCGDLANLSVRGTRFLQEMEKKGIDYVCAMGVENICADVCDPYMIGLLVTNPNVAVSFKCTYPNNEDENLKRLVFNKTKKFLEATEFESLNERADKKCQTEIKKSPVWMDNLVFRLKHLREYKQKKKQNFNTSQVFTVKKMQLTYWNPATNEYLNNQHGYSFERQLNDLLLNEDLKTIGVMVEREHQFVPVISLYEEHTWEDAYNQYQYNQKNNNKQIKEDNFVSMANYTERSEFL